MASEPHSLIVEKARRSLGTYEPHILPSDELPQYELSSAGGLKSIKCEKNPGHINFIARDDFRLEHLPPGYQDQLLFDFVDTTADLTGLLTVKHVSEGRPETMPGTLDPYPCGDVRGTDLAQTGTGRVCRVESKFYTEKDGWPCPCWKCAVSDTPSLTWGKFNVFTAAHVHIDDMEVRTSDMRLFYRSGSPYDSRVKVAYGVRVVRSDIGRDWCEAEYVTHEETVCNTLVETWLRWRDLQEKVYKKYYSYYNNNKVVGRPTIIVSHPHAAHHHITVGHVTHREEENERSDWSRYTYSTDTCEGSSGAALLLPGRYDDVWWFDHHPHSRACPPGQDGSQSAVYMDFPPILDSNDDSSNRPEPSPATKPTRLAEEPSPATQATRRHKRKKSVCSLM